MKKSVSGTRPDYSWILQREHYSWLTGALSASKTQVWEELPEVTTESVESLDPEVRRESYQAGSFRPRPILSQDN